MNEILLNKIISRMAFMHVYIRLAIFTASFVNKILLIRTVLKFMYGRLLNVHCRQNVA